MLFNAFTNSLNITTVTQLFSIAVDTLLGFAPTKAALLNYDSWTTIAKYRL